MGGSAPTYYSDKTVLKWEKARVQAGKMKLTPDQIFRAAGKRLKNLMSPPGTKGGYWSHKQIEAMHDAFFEYKAFVESQRADLCAAIDEKDAEIRRGRKSH